MNKKIKTDKKQSSIENSSKNSKNILPSDISANIDALENAIADPEKSIKYADKAVENRDVSQQIVGLNLMGALQLIQNGNNPVPPLFTMVSRGRVKR